MLDRWHAARATAKDITTDFTTLPAPRTIGRVDGGKQLVAGHFLIAGRELEIRGRSLWDAAPDDLGVRDALQSFGWLDDLAALGTDTARNRAQVWLLQWIDRYGRGGKEGWAPDIAGSRMLRWINHGPFVLQGLEEAKAARFRRSIARQTLYLARRWHSAAPGLPMIRAQVGTIYAACMLEGMITQAGPAATALATTCQQVIDTDGAIANRQPETLLEVLTLLNHAWQALSDARQHVPTHLTDTITRIAPTLRALRHADGSLARFHGGGAGVPGRLDEALAAARTADVPTPGVHMGFVKLTGARTSVIVDAAAPPKGPDNRDAHASTLAIEVTSGRRPMIVSGGPGQRFGGDWHRTSRTTASHSTLVLDGTSSSQLKEMGPAAPLDAPFATVPSVVNCKLSDGTGGRTLELSHDGYRKTYGLTHARIMKLGIDGRQLQCEDLLTTLGSVDEGRFDTMQGRAGEPGLPFSLRFHLHPDVSAALKAEGTTVSLTLKSGEVWLMRFEGPVVASLYPSIYFETGRIKPRATQQVVFSGRAMSYATRVRWSLAKADDTPTVVRDLAMADAARP